MYIWRKNVDTRSLSIQSENLAQRFDTRLAVIERPGRKRVTLEVACRTAKQAREIIREFGGQSLGLRSDWLQQVAKKTQSNPLYIGSRLVILRNRSESARSPRQGRGRRSIIIPAEAAFGTGEHATTAMCLRFLERISRRLKSGWTMLDAGTGSGILAIAGSCFGATRVLAIDNDPIACRTAKRNIRANDARDIEVSCGDIQNQKLTETFDVITANLFSEILIKAMPAWSRHLSGSLIFSGILRSQEKEVTRRLPQHGLAVTEIRRRGKWIAGIAVRIGQAAKPPGVRLRKSASKSAQTEIDQRRCKRS